MLTKLIKAFDLYVMSPKIAIAVSGGLDSMVLMKLANISKKINSKNIHIIVIDHDLREGSKEEALFVKEEASKLGLRSAILTWKGKKPTSKIQESARNERYNLLFNYCKKNHISDLFLGHHLDDQIENFIFRMFRGSGVVGLTSFSNFSKRDGINLIRPLIEIPKSDLLVFAKKQK
ncbi:tRNA lysidine(34) synthetase TilS, partial [OCS116 cluster bacterium]|nr:tRNA lysidine(34) synthetase TilS [OCS116 cluster bacterium]